MGLIDMRPWWDKWFEWIFVLIGVMGLSPFLLAAFFSVGCFVFEDRNSCWVLSLVQDVKHIEISPPK